MLNNKKTNENVLITGGCGFVGSSLITSLRKKTGKIIVVDNLSGGNENIFNEDDKIEFIKLNICDKQNLTYLFETKKPNIVIHLAAKHYIPWCNNHLSETIQTNINGTLNIVELMGKYKIPRLIFSSSASVYTPSNLAHTEEEKLDPIDIYGKSKQIGECVIQSLCQLFNIKYTIFRLFNIFGPNDKNPHIIPEMMSQFHNAKSVTAGNIMSMRDYVWIDDVVEGIIKSLDNKNANNQIINLGSGNLWSVKDIFNELRLISGKKLDLHISENKKRNIDSPVLLADIDKAQQNLDWHPNTNFKEGLHKIYTAS